MFWTRNGAPMGSKNVWYYLKFKYKYDILPFYGNDINLSEIDHTTSDAAQQINFVTDHYLSLLIIVCHVINS